MNIETVEADNEAIEYPGATALALIPKGGEVAAVDIWNQDRLELLKKTVAKDLSTDEFLLFVELCKSRRLNPFNNQVYAIKRSGKLTVTTAIDGYRLIAQRSGEYRGQSGPFWCGKDGAWKDVWLEAGNPAAAKVGVYRAMFAEPVWGTALWTMYGGVGPFWAKGAAHMLAKVAEALALKKAFPEELSGLYTTDEMDNSIEDTPKKHIEKSGGGSASVKADPPTHQPPQEPRSTPAPPLSAPSGPPPEIAKTPMLRCKLMQVKVSDKNAAFAQIKNMDGDIFALWGAEHHREAQMALERGLFVQFDWESDGKFKKVSNFEVEPR